MKKYISIILASVFLFACSPPDPGITSDIQTLDPGEPYSDHVVKINSNFANLNTDKLEDAPSDGSQYARQDGAWSVITAGGGAVDSVFGRTGAVIAESGDYASFYLALASCTTSGQIPKWNGSAWACATDETGSGSLPPGNAANDILQWDGTDWLAQGYINGLIDDTAGDGDATAVLSANEINTRIAAVNEVPAGGTTGQVLGKASDTDNDVAWIDQTGSGGGVTSIIAGTNITIDPASGVGDVTINAATDSVGGYVPVPTNSDSACTEGQYAIDRANNFIYWCYAANSWDRVSSTFDQWDNPSTVYYTLTISPVPTNGRIIEPGDSTNINCGTGGNDCDNDYETGTDAVLTAIAESGYSLDTWTGTNLTDNGDGTATVHIDQDISDVSATFVADTGDAWPADPANAEYITVDTDGVSGDFSSLFDAEAAIGTTGYCENIGTIPCVITVAATTGVADTTIVDFSGHIPTDGARLYVRPTLSNRHGGVYNTGVYRLETTTGVALSVTDSFTTIRGLQISSDSYVGIYINDYREHVIVDSCLIKDSSGGILVLSSGVGNSGHIIANNIIYGVASGIWYNNDVLWTYPNYIINNTVYGTTTRGIDCKSTNGNVYATNNISTGGSTNGDFYRCDNEDYNISSDATATGTNSVPNQTDADIAFVDTTSFDFHILTGSTAENIGADESARITWDIDSDSRTIPFDIGADQL